MQVKGTAFLARRALLEKDVGAAKVRPFLDRFCAAHPGFPSPVLPTSLISIETFLELNDAIVHELYGGDEASYWRFGRMSGEWALTEGPYRRIREEKSLPEFAASAPALYRNYFTEGRARSVLEPGGAIQLWIEDIRPRFHHVYFEYAIVGYFERGLELVSGKPVKKRRIRGFSAGDESVHYRYQLG
jgi:hypothetical protein